MTSKFQLFPGRLCLRQIILLAWFKVSVTRNRIGKQEGKIPPNAAHWVEKNVRIFYRTSNWFLPKCISSAQARKHKWQVSLGVDWCAQMMFPSLSPDARKVSTVWVVGGKSKQQHNLLHLSVAESQLRAGFVHFQRFRGENSKWRTWVLFLLWLFSSFLYFLKMRNSRVDVGI